MFLHKWFEDPPASLQKVYYLKKRKKGRLLFWRPWLRYVTVATMQLQINFMANNVPKVI